MAIIGNIAKQFNTIRTDLTNAYLRIEYITVDAKTGIASCILAGYLNKDSAAASRLSEEEELSEKLKIFNNNEIVMTNLNQYPIHVENIRPALVFLDSYSVLIPESGIETQKIIEYLYNKIKEFEYRITDMVDDL